MGTAQAESASAMTEPVTRTSLTRFAGLMQDPDPDRRRRLLTELYDKHGVLVIVKDDVERGLATQWAVDALAKTLYPNGRRR